MLIGNLTANPIFKELPTGGQLVTCCVATNRSWKKGDEIKEETEFTRIAAWGQLAELFNRLLKKGDKIFLRGRLQTRKLTNKEGEEYEVSEVIASDMILLESKKVVEEKVEEVV